MDKKEYWVEIPLNAKITVLVEAETKEEALEQALQNIDLEFNPKSEKGYQLEEWDVYDKMLQGNFWNGIIYEANVEENKW